MEAAFKGGDIVSNGGVLLLMRVDDPLGLTRAAALAFGDERRGGGVAKRFSSSITQLVDYAARGQLD